MAVDEAGVASHTHLVFDYNTPECPWDREAAEMLAREKLENMKTVERRNITRHRIY